MTNEGAAVLLHPDTSRSYFQKVLDTQGSTTETNHQVSTMAANALRKYEELMESYKYALEMSSSMESCRDCVHRKYDSDEGAFCGNGLRCEPEWNGAE